MAFLPGIGPLDLIIVLVIVLLLFGPKKLPQLGKSLGKSIKAIREGVEGKGESTDEDSASAKATGAESDEPKESNSGKKTDEA